MRIIFLVFLFVSSCKATTLDEQLAQDAYLATVNAAIVFTSQDGLSSGVYRFTKIDTQMRMYNLPLSYHFDPFTERTNLFMVFDFAYSDTRSDNSVEDVNGTLLNVDNQLQTYVAGIGGGLRYRATDHSDLLIAGELFYSRVGLSVRAEDGLNPGDVTNFFSDDFNQNFSYKLMAEYDYHRNYKGYDLYTKLNYKLYKTLSKLDFSVIDEIVSDLKSLSSQTMVSSLIVGFETEPLYRHNDMSLTLEPYMKGNYIWGDLASIAQVSSYATVGLSVYWNTPEKSAYIYRYFIEPSVSRGNGLEGLNLSLGFSLDF